MQDAFFLQVYKSKNISSDNLFSSFELKQGKNFFGKSFFLANIILSLRSVADIHFSIEMYHRSQQESFVKKSKEEESTFFDLEIMEGSKQNLDDHGRVLEKNKVYCYSKGRVFYLANQYACVLVRGDALNLTKCKIQNSFLRKLWFGS